MRAAERNLYTAGALLIIAAILPRGTLVLFVAGLVLALAATGCASAADNHDLTFGRGEAR